MTKPHIPASRNEDHGFFGAISHHADPGAAWGIAFRAVATATGCTDAAIRDFLDSGSGRHFADTVVDGLFAGHGMEDAVAEAVEDWMWRKIEITFARKYRIPHGNPYLLGFVTAHQSAGGRR